MSTPRPNDIDTAPKKRKALVLSGGGGRGAFQWGVFEALERLGWRPDIIVGTSIGSMNGAVYALDGLAGVRRMWQEIRTRDMHRFFRLPPWAGIFDRTPWERTLEKYIPEARLKESQFPLYIVSMDIDRAHPVVYTNTQRYETEKNMYRPVEGINHQHLMASSSIPHIYPYTKINEDRFWDGAVLYNSPLRPAVDAGAEQILIVLMSPYHNAYHGSGRLPLPFNSVWAKASHLLDLAITATFENDFEQMRKINRQIQSGDRVSNHREIEAAIIGPDAWLPMWDIVRYSPKRAAKLRDAGIKAVSVTRERIRRNGWDSLG